MKKRNYPQNKTVQKVKRERDTIPWRYCALTLICGLFLVGGFFFAAKQHFAAIEYGIKNSKLKKQLGDLEDEKRRLLLDKEFAISPAEITKSAKKIGLTAVNGAISLVTGDQTTAKTENTPVSASPGKKSNDQKDTQAFSGNPKPGTVVREDEKTAKNDKPKADKSAGRSSDKKGNKL